MGLLAPSNFQGFSFLLIVVSFASILLCVCPRSQLCKSEEKNALLQFKSHFSVNKSSGGCTLRTTSWEDDEDCCNSSTWLGVVCDDMTGHVIGLNLDQSCLNGTIPLNSSLFSLVHLQDLSLGNNHFGNSPISPSFSNLSKLTNLGLQNSEFSGIVPNEIFELPELQNLYLGQNFRLSGKIISPNSTQQSKLVIIDLSDSGFTGELPDSIDQFKSLQYLYFAQCNFFGSIPASLGNLTKLKEIFFKNNHFSGEIPSSISSLQNLGLFDVSYNKLHGPIPPSLSNLTNLFDLFLQGNALSGHFPSQLLNFSRLWNLDVSENRLTGNIDLDMFIKLPELGVLSLSKSGLSVRNTNSSILSSLPKIQFLSLSSCSISTSNLTYFNAPKGLNVLDLSENKIDTEIHPSICIIYSLTYLDLSDNKLSGPIPACLGSSTSLVVLKLEKNNLQGVIPRSIGYSGKLQVLDLSNNQLQGVVPRLLENCTEIEVINLGHNMLVDVFPFWLGFLPILKILILGDNKFHGRISMESESGKGFFANLHIFDVSHNNLTGDVPSKFFLNLKSLMNSNEGIPGSLYMQNTYTDDFYSVSITNKGEILDYPKLLVNFKLLDFSQNKFSGNIPLSVGNFKGVQGLNFSRNMLNGPVPSCLGDLTYLESLDLSLNKLSGKIPQELASLGFLEVFNISYNNFSGVIPRGGQFDTFSSTSYEGNLGLCGPPLLKLCSNPIAIAPTPALSPKSHHFKFEFSGFGWEEVLVGYVGGLVLSLIISFILVKEEWLERFFRVKMHLHVKHR